MPQPPFRVRAPFRFIECSVPGVLLLLARRFNRFTGTTWHAEDYFWFRSRIGATHAMQVSVDGQRVRSVSPSLANRASA